MIPLWLTAAAPAKDVAIQKKIYNSERESILALRHLDLAQQTTALLMKQVKELKMKQKNKKVDFLVCCQVLGKGSKEMSRGRKVIKAGEGTING